MAFRQLPEGLDPVDVILLVSEDLRVVDPVMMEVGDIERVVSPELVHIDDAVGPHVFPNDRQQGLCLGVWNDRRVCLNTHNVGCGAGRASDNKMLDQLTFLTARKAALPSIHRSLDRTLLRFLATSAANSNLINYLQ